MNLNRKIERSNFFYDINITKYWLLGFIEGEGNF